MFYLSPVIDLMIVTLDPFKVWCVISVTNPTGCLNLTNFIQECPSLYIGVNTLCLDHETSHENKVFVRIPENKDCRHSDISDLLSLGQFIADNPSVQNLVHLLHRVHFVWDNNTL